MLPRYYGENGWYGFHDGESGSPGGLGNLREVETDIYMWALETRDLERLPKRGWIGYLTSGDPAYPLAAFQQGLEEIRGAAAFPVPYLRNEIRSRMAAGPRPTCAGSLAARLWP